MAARYGGKGLWYGEYSGRARDETSDRFYPFAGRGCFTNERDCRRWTQQMASQANGFSAIMRCLPYRAR